MYITFHAIFFSCAIVEYLIIIGYYKNLYLHKIYITCICKGNILKAYYYLVYSTGNYLHSINKNVYFIQLIRNNVL